ncbi:MAG: GIY-YIG nuclease family protein [Parcubacteria group bacterium]|nr:GIY-YIG nuclease family protein [Parcubacteria group bacterium]
MEKKDLEKLAVPDSPGVYTFLGAHEEILYIGKAASLKSRVRSYFASDLAETRGEHIRAMVASAAKLAWEETDSVLEALILEANLIKRHQPLANSKERDNRSFNYLVITKEAYPRVLVVRGRELFQKWDKKHIKHLFGPFPEGGSLKEALKLVREIFPFRDGCTPGIGKPCFNKQIGLCPGVCDGSVSQREYAHIVRHIVLLFSGKKKALLMQLGREMKQQSRAEQFEAARATQRAIRALTHIRDVALIRRDAFESRGGEVNHFRIEAYDIAHTGGSETVGVMVVVEGGEAKKSDYRMFKVRGFKNNDTGALTEILDRRLAHAEWPSPRLIVIDGGKNQLNAAAQVLSKAGVVIPLVAVVKDERHRPREIIGDTSYRSAHERDILLANAEAHRFAKKYHTKRLGRLV